MAPKGAVVVKFVELLVKPAFFQSSLAGVRLECWEELHPVRWWHRQEAYSTPRRFALLAGGHGGWFSISCYHEPRCLPTQGSPHSNTLKQRPSRRERQRQRALHSCLCVVDDVSTKLKTRSGWSTLGFRALGLAFTTTRHFVSFVSFKHGQN